MSATDRSRADVFTYAGFELNPNGVLACHYASDSETFTETIDCGVSEGAFDSPAAQSAARLVFLLVGVSYYKTGAAHRIAVPAGLTDREREFLHDVHIHGLAEFAHTERLDISDIVIDAPVIDSLPPATYQPSAGPLIPFGGGIDSIVVVDETRQQHADAALFVMNSSATPYEPIETSAAVTGLPILRARRTLDPKVLTSRERGYFNGHVPVTGVLSAIAVLVAVAHGRNSVVMSNEFSASEPTGLMANGVPVNHQWSKSVDFERSFRGVLADAVAGIDYYSAIRPYSELWVAERFAKLTDFHLKFRSCNRAFHVNAADRAATWCGECDKCCFIDLILAPYLTPAELTEIFDGTEPLSRGDLEPVFRSLLGQPDTTKPLECVGDEGECRRAALMAADRPDRADSALLSGLADYVRSSTMATPSESELQQVRGEHFLPAVAVR